MKTLAILSALLLAAAPQLCRADGKIAAGHADFESTCAAPGSQQVRNVSCRSDTAASSDPAKRDDIRSHAMAAGSATWRDTPSLMDTSWRLWPSLTDF